MPSARIFSLNCTVVGLTAKMLSFRKLTACLRFEGTKRLKVLPNTAFAELETSFAERYILLITYFTLSSPFLLASVTGLSFKAGSFSRALPAKIAAKPISNNPDPIAVLIIGDAATLAASPADISGTFIAIPLKMPAIPENPTPIFENIRPILPTFVFGSIYPISSFLGSFFSST